MKLAQSLKSWNLLCLVLELQLASADLQLRYHKSVSFMNFPFFWRDALSDFNKNWFPSLANVAKPLTMYQSQHTQPTPCCTSDSSLGMPSKYSLVGIGWYMVFSINATPDLGILQKIKGPQEEAIERNTTGGSFAVNQAASEFSALKNGILGRVPTCSHFHFIVEIPRGIQYPTHLFLGSLNYPPSWLNDNPPSSDLITMVPEDS